MACEGESILQTDATISTENYHPSPSIDSKSLENLTTENDHCLRVENTIIAEEETSVLQSSEDSLDSTNPINQHAPPTISQPATTALDTLVQTACQSLATTDQSISVQNALEESPVDVEELQEVEDDGGDVDSTPTLLDAAIVSATTSTITGHASLNDGFNGTIGAIFETNGSHDSDMTSHGNGISAIGLPTMAFKPVQTSLQADIGDADGDHIMEELQEEESNEQGSDLLRKSDRKRKPLRPNSPENQPKVKRKKKRTHRQSTSATQVPEQPFKCDLCGAPYVTNPSRRGNRMKTSTHQPSPRHKVDPQTGKRLTLCNACGLSFDRPKKPQKEKAQPDATEKTKYLEEAHLFALSLVDGLGDPDAERLSCPHFKVRACGCMQNYIVGDGNNVEESRNRASDLLQLLKRAKELSKLKCYDINDTKSKGTYGKAKRVRAIGLGNGQRKAKDFEDFVLEKRVYLRETVKLCERATQRVLLYSNNFLHKKLKTDPAKSIRIKRQKGKAALGKLRPLEELPQERCCVDNCVMIVLTHMKLIQNWRDRATSGQIEARRVLAEMLTPSGGARSNCYKFISWVTGCSHSTIGRVNEQMKETGGDREPPTHGLIKWWREHPKPKKPKPAKQVPQQVSQLETVQQLALQQIQQAVPQMTNLLQTNTSSSGITAVILPPSVAPLATTLPLTTTLPLATVNTAQIAQSQIPAVTLTNGTIQLQQVQQQQQIQAHLQQQQSQYQQQIQQLQLQQLQLQQQQQQLQQQLQQTTQQLQQTTQQQQLTQSIQHCLASQIQIQTASGTTQQVLQPQELQVVQQVQTTQPQTTQVQQEAAQTEAPQETQHSVTNIAPTNVLTVTIPANLSVSQATPLTTETFLTSDAFQLLNSVPGVQHQVVTIPVTSGTGITQGIPGVTQGVPVSLIQTNVQNSIQ